jgi:hypothetical protein
MKDTQMLAKDRKRDSGRSRAHTGRSGRDIGRSRMQKDMQKERGTYRYMKMQDGGGKEFCKRYINMKWEVHGKQ